MDIITTNATTTDGGRNRHVHDAHASRVRVAAAIHDVGGYVAHGQCSNRSGRERHGQ
jgi:hypothetical protein